MSEKTFTFNMNIDDEALRGAEIRDLVREADGFGASCSTAALEWMSERLIAIGEPGLPGAPWTDEEKVA